MKKLFLLLPFLCCCFSAFAQTTLGGKITAVDTGEELIGANVTVSQNGYFVTGTSTDFDGNYKLRVKPGTYDVEAAYIGFPPNKVTGVIITEGQNNRLDIHLGGGLDLEVCPITTYPFRIISKDNTTSGLNISQEQINNSPSKNINTIVRNTPGVILTW